MTKLTTKTNIFCKFASFPTASYQFLLNTLAKVLPSTVGPWSNNLTTCGHRDAELNSASKEKAFVWERDGRTKILTTKTSDGLQPSPAAQKRRAHAIFRFLVSHMTAPSWRGRAYSMNQVIKLECQRIFVRFWPGWKPPDLGTWPWENIVLHKFHCRGRKY